MVCLVFIELCGDGILPGLARKGLPYSVTKYINTCTVYVVHCTLTVCAYTVSIVSP